MFEVEAMLEQQLKAVAYLHGIGITHRDIKPENILVESRYPNIFTKLSDLGLSSKDEHLQTFCGTKTYLAPEVVSMTPEYTIRVDIWSLGVVALEFAYRFPKKQKRWQAALQSHTHEQHGDLAILLRKMLSLRPSVRPSANECLLDMKSWKLAPSSGSSRPTLTEKSKDRPQRPCRTPQVVKARPGRPGRPGGLFAAISSENNLETKLQALATFVGKDVLHDEKTTVKMAATFEKPCEGNEKRDEGLGERRSSIGSNTGRVKWEVLYSATSV